MYTFERFYNLMLKSSNMYHLQFCRIQCEYFGTKIRNSSFDHVKVLFFFFDKKVLFCKSMHFPSQGSKVSFEEKMPIINFPCGPRQSDA